MPQDAPSPTPQKDQHAEAEKAAPDADPLTCLHGTWLADNAFFLERIQDFGNEVHGVNGRVSFQLDTDGTFTTEYQDWIISAVYDGAAYSCDANDATVVTIDGALMLTRQ